MKGRERTGPGLAVFDVCDTLFRENTTFGFLRFFHRGHSAYAVREWLAVSRISPAFYAGAIALRFFGRDVARQWLVRSLRGISRLDLETAAVSYARQLLLERSNAPLIDRLEQHRHAGDRLVLVSSSLDIVIAPIAERLSTEFRASALGFRDDVCTGRIVDDLTGRKETVVHALRGREKLRLHVYTDNRSDQGLIDIADEATIIVPRGRSSRWGEGQGCDLIRL